MCVFVFSCHKHTRDNNECTTDVMLYAAQDALRLGCCQLLDEICYITF